MTPAEARAADVIFIAYNGQPNLITPKVVRFGWRPDGCAYELSTGEGIFGAPIWGVSVVDPRHPERRTPRSKCCHSLEEAETYIKAGAPG